MVQLSYPNMTTGKTIALTTETFVGKVISRQSILKKINPEYSLEGLKLKLQYFGYLIQSQLIGKDPDAGKD